MKNCLKPDTVIYMFICSISCTSELLNLCARWDKRKVKGVDDMKLWRDWKWLVQSFRTTQNNGSKSNFTKGNRLHQSTTINVYPTVCLVTNTWYCFGYKLTSNIISWFASSVSIIDCSIENGFIYLHSICLSAAGSSSGYAWFAVS